MPSVFPADYTTAIGQVRLLIPDMAQDEDGLYLFEDEQVEGLLALFGGNVKRAAAQAKDTIATDQTLLMKAVRTDDLSVDGPRVGAELRLQAKALRDQAKAEDDEAAWDFFQIVYRDPHLHYPPEATPMPFQLRTTF